MASFSQTPPWLVADQERRRAEHEHMSALAWTVPPPSSEPPLPAGRHTHDELQAALQLQQLRPSGEPRAVTASKPLNPMDRFGGDNRLYEPRPAELLPERKRSLSPAPPPPPVQAAAAAPPSCSSRKRQKLQTTAASPQGFPRSDSALDGLAPGDTSEATSESINTQTKPAPAAMPIEYLIPAPAGDVYCPGYRRGCLSTKPLISEDFMKRGKRLKCCQYCRATNSAYQLGYIQKNAAVKAEALEGAIPAPSGSNPALILPPASEVAASMPAASDLKAASSVPVIQSLAAEAPAVEPPVIKQPVVKLEAARAPPSLKIRLIRPPAEKTVQPDVVSPDAAGSLATPAAALGLATPDAGPPSATSAEAGPSTGPIAQPFCVGFRGKGPSSCVAPRPLAPIDFDHRNGSKKRACVFCRETNRLRRRSSQPQLQKKARQLQQKDTATTTPPLFSSSAFSGPRRISLPNSGSSTPYDVHLRRPLASPTGSAVPPEETKMTLPELLEALVAQLAEVIASAAKLLFATSIDELTLDFHGESAVLDRPLSNFVEARGRVIDSLGILLLHLADKSPKVGKCVVDTIGSFETSPAAFPRAEHHIVESYQLWRVRRMIVHDPADLPTITATIEDCFPPPVAVPASSPGGKARLEGSPGALILRATCFSLAKDAAVAAIAPNEGPQERRVRTYLQGGKYVPLDTVPWEKLKTDLVDWVGDVLTAVEGGNQLVTKLRDAQV